MELIRLEKTLKITESIYKKPQQPFLKNMK